MQLSAAHRTEFRRSGFPVDPGALIESADLSAPSAKRTAGKPPEPDCCNQKAENQSADQCGRDRIIRRRKRPSGRCKRSCRLCRICDLFNRKQCRHFIHGASPSLQRNGTRCITAERQRTVLKRKRMTVRQWKPAADSEGSRRKEDSGFIIAYFRQLDKRPPGFLAFCRFLKVNFGNIAEIRGAMPKKARIRSICAGMMTNLKQFLEIPEIRQMFLHSAAEYAIIQTGSAKNAGFCLKINEVNLCVSNMFLRPGCRCF